MAASWSAGHAFESAFIHVSETDVFHGSFLLVGSSTALRADR